MERFNYVEAYTRALDRSYTIDAVLALNPVFEREYLNTLSTNELHDLEDSLINTQFET